MPQSTVQGAAMATQMGQIFDMAGVDGVKLGEAVLALGWDSSPVWSDP